MSAASGLSSERREPHFTQAAVLEEGNLEKLVAGLA
jgi:hypothetical protein